MMPSVAVKYYIEERSHKMNRLKKLLLCCALFMAAAAAFTEENIQTKSIPFQDENGALSIKNNTTADVVIFAGRVERKIILGGIKSGSARSFDIKKIPSVPTQGTFLIHAVNYETVKRKTFIMEDDVIYTGLVTYNVDDKNDMSQLIIPNSIDTQQQFCVYVGNESANYILELRIDNPRHGYVVAALLPFEWNKRIYLSPRADGLAYSFYPTFVYVNPKTGEKTSISGNDYDTQRVIPQKVGAVAAPMRFSEPSKSDVKYDVAFVSLQNDTSRDVEFHNARRTLQNQRESRFTPSGHTDVYELQATNEGDGQVYTALFLEFEDFTEKTISPYKFKAGYKYALVVTQVDGAYHYDIHETGKKTLVEDMRMDLLFE